MKKFWMMRILKGLVLFVLLGSLFSFVVMDLWNMLMPTLFTGLHAITFWQALGLIVLSKILFGGFHGGRRWGGHGHWKGGHYWKERWEQKLQHMTPEERERFKSEWQSRCKMWGKYSETPSANPTAEGDTKM